MADGSPPTAPRLPIRLNAKFEGQRYAARLEGGWRYAVQPTLGITPYAALQSQLSRTPASSETDLTGGGFGLAYNASATHTRSELGARVDSLALVGGTPLIPARPRRLEAPRLGEQSGDRRHLRGTARLGFHGQRRAPPKNSTLTAAPRGSSSPQHGPPR